MFKQIARFGFLLLAGGSVLSACGASAEGDGAATGTSQEALKIGGLGLDGDACCAVDYRGGGTVIMCGERKGEWCCTADDSHRALCSWYECEPPAPTPAPSLHVKVAAVRGVSATLRSVP